MIVIGGLYVLRCFLFISLQKSVAHARLSYCHFYFLEILFDVSAAVPVTGTFHRRRAFKESPLTHTCEVRSYIEQNLVGEVPLH